MQETPVKSLGWEDPWKGNGYPLQYSCLDNSMDRGAQWATVRGVIVFLYIRNEQLEFEIKNVLWFTVTSKNK